MLVMPSPAQRCATLLKHDVDARISYAPLGKPKMDGTPAGATERHEDFFFLSELRLHVLHALGVINWVWY